MGNPLSLGVWIVIYPKIASLDFPDLCIRHFFKYIKKNNIKKLPGLQIMLFYVCATFPPFKSIASVAFLYHFNSELEYFVWIVHIFVFLSGDREQSSLL